MFPDFPEGTGWTVTSESVVDPPPLFATTFAENSVRGLLTFAIGETHPGFNLDSAGFISIEVQGEFFNHNASAVDIPLTVDISADSLASGGEHTPSSTLPWMTC